MIKRIILIVLFTFSVASAGHMQEMQRAVILKGAPASLCTTLDYDSGAPTTVSTVAFRLASSRHWVANAYTPTSALDACRVQIALEERIGTAGTTMHVEFYSDNAGEPGAQIGVSSEAVNFTEVPVATGATYIDFSFSTPVSLTGSTLYWVVIKPDWVLTNDTYCSTSVLSSAPNNLYYWTGSTWSPSGGTIGGFKIYE